MVEVVQVFPVRQLVDPVDLLVREEARVHAYDVAEHGGVAAVRRRFNNFEARVFADGRRARVRLAEVVGRYAVEGKHERRVPEHVAAGLEN